ncbi:hypothetical protein K493DRAFT_349169 [Basidiobolus meristosporus CBS 931.73]|uniref:Uncharacterized protein n=1 Tax=Basidiobolus meristosporus CBS 931.73 TaxID=1314790 RepID=A0A1Y1YKM2_9FUNG|nr:hypothetical protein K493DRAFT_349168 [Basidiobolus meristosporus CBS 931.73]ORX98571.1 hypothetical protein K493DRAFT_349169 [Basidiobolus meristosporus CBS 931.73]|eukprot:ORX98570.1 hypothetical protein K493DRAFT_349168 [Basidiobolus meristosporus CBS 931.73]
MRLSAVALLSIVVVSSSWMLAAEAMPFEITAVMKNVPDQPGTETTTATIKSVEATDSAKPALAPAPMPMSMSKPMNMGGMDSEASPTFKEKVASAWAEDVQPNVKPEGQPIRESLKQKFDVMLQNMEKKVTQMRKEAAEPISDSGR